MNLSVLTWVDAREEAFSDVEAFSELLSELADNEVTFVRQDHEWLWSLRDEEKTSHASLTEAVSAALDWLEDNQ